MAMVMPEPSIPSAQTSLDPMIDEAPDVVVNTPPEKASLVAFEPGGWLQIAAHSSSKDGFCCREMVTSPQADPIPPSGVSNPT